MPWESLPSLMACSQPLSRMGSVHMVERQLDAWPRHPRHADLSKV